MTDKLPGSGDDKGFAGFSSLVSDISKDIEQVSKQEIHEIKATSRPVQASHNPSQSTKINVWLLVKILGARLVGRLQKIPGKFYAGLVVIVCLVWIGGGFRNNNHPAEVSDNSVLQDGRYRKAAIGYYYSGSSLKRHSSINVVLERNSGRTDAEILVPLAKQMNFNLAGARDGGYTDQEIIESLISNQILDTETPSRASVDERHVIGSLPELDLTEFEPNRASVDERHVVQVPPVIKSDPLAFAPNGKPWPTRSGYLSGYAKLNSGGLSSLTIDNTSNDSNVYLKLFTLDETPPVASRHVFIKAGDKFTFRSVSAGSYDVRYRDLRYGGISKTDSFELHEIHEDGGTRYSQMTMTLYKVQNGNMQMHGITESEF